MLTRLDIIQRAAVRIGDEKPASETDPRAEVYLAIFGEVSDDLLSRHPWKFATHTRRLTRLQASPPAHWKYLYQLPSEMLGSPRAVFDRADLHAAFTRYALTENRLATDAETIWLQFGVRAPIALWPPWFVTLVTRAVMRDAALAVREDRVLYESLGAELYGSPQMMGEGGLLGQAKAQDTLSGPSPVIAEGDNPLIAARFA